jgi:hypothetical protein
MSETSPTPPTDVKPSIPANLGPFVLAPLNHALAAGEREALKVGVPPHNVIEMLLNHLASVVAMVEPPGARKATIEQLVTQFGDMVAQHVRARMTTPGGVLLPKVGLSPEGGAEV